MCDETVKQSSVSHNHSCLRCWWQKTSFTEGLIRLWDTWRYRISLVGAWWWTPLRSFSLSEFLPIDPSQKLHNASVEYVTMHHFATEMCTHVHISVIKWCIVGYGIDALWDFEMGLFTPFLNQGVYTKFSGRLSEEPFPWLIQKFPCILIFKTGQPGCQLNLSEGQIRLDLTSGRPLV